MADIPICECATFWNVHPNECPVRREIESLRATISRLKNELREIDIAIDDPESNLTKTQAECVLKMHRTISRLREYARHKPSCCWWRGPSCDCGYDALMAELEDKR